MVEAAAPAAMVIAVVIAETATAANATAKQNKTNKQTKNNKKQKTKQNQTKNKKTTTLSTTKKQRRSTINLADWPLQPTPVCYGFNMEGKKKYATNPHKEANQWRPGQWLRCRPQRNRSLRCRARWSTTLSAAAAPAADWWHGSHRTWQTPAGRSLRSSSRRVGPSGKARQAAKDAEDTGR